jgi:transcriptional regulator with XRE-family HTH domain
VQQWENGRNGPKRTRLGHLASILGVTEQYLLTGNDPSMGDLMENQALSLFRGLPKAMQDVAVQQLQVLYTASNKGISSSGNPFGGKLPPTKT